VGARPETPRTDGAGAGPTRWSRLASPGQTSPPRPQDGEARGGGERTAAAVRRLRQQEEELASLRAALKTLGREKHGLETCMLKQARELAEQRDALDDLRRRSKVQPEEELTAELAALRAEAGALRRENQRLEGQRHEVGKHQEWIERVDPDTPPRNGDQAMEVHDQTESRMLDLQQQLLSAKATALQCEDLRLQAHEQERELAEMREALDALRREKRRWSREREEFGDIAQLYEANLALRSENEQLRLQIVDVEALRSKTHINDSGDQEIDQLRKSCALENQMLDEQASELDTLRSELRTSEAENYAKGALRMAANQASGEQHDESAEDSQLSPFSRSRRLLLEDQTREVAPLHDEIKSLQAKCKQLESQTSDLETRLDEGNKLEMKEHESNKAPVPTIPQRRSSGWRTKLKSSKGSSDALEPSRSETIQPEHHSEVLVETKETLAEHQHESLQEERRQETTVDSAQSAPSKPRRQWRTSMTRDSLQANANTPSLERPEPELAETREALLTSRAENRALEMRVCAQQEECAKVGEAIVELRSENRMLEFREREFLLGYEDTARPRTKGRLSSARRAGLGSYLKEFDMFVLNMREALDKLSCVEHQDVDGLGYENQRSKEQANTLNELCESLERFQRRSQALVSLEEEHEEPRDGPETPETLHTRLKAQSGGLELEATERNSETLAMQHELASLHEVISALRRENQLLEHKEQDTTEWQNVEPHELMDRTHDGSQRQITDRGDNRNNVPTAALETPDSRELELTMLREALDQLRREADSSSTSLREERCALAVRQMELEELCEDSESFRHEHRRRNSEEQEIVKLREDLCSLRDECRSMESQPGINNVNPPQYADPQQLELIEFQQAWNLLRQDCHKFEKQEQIHEQALVELQATVDAARREDPRLESEEHEWSVPCRTLDHLRNENSALQNQVLAVACLQQDVDTLRRDKRTLERWFDGQRQELRDEMLQAHGALGQLHEMRQADSEAMREQSVMYEVLLLDFAKMEEVVRDTHTRAHEEIGNVRDEEERASHALEHESHELATLRVEGQDASTAQAEKWEGLLEEFDCLTTRNRELEMQEQELLELYSGVDQGQQEHRSSDLLLREDDHQRELVELEEAVHLIRGDNHKLEYQEQELVEHHGRKHHNLEQQQHELAELLDSKEQQLVTLRENLDTCQYDNSVLMNQRQDDHQRELVELEEAVHLIRGDNHKLEYQEQELVEHHGRKHHNLEQQQHELAELLDSKEQELVTLRESLDTCQYDNCVLMNQLQDDHQRELVELEEAVHLIRGDIHKLEYQEQELVEHHGRKHHNLEQQQHELAELLDSKEQELVTLRESLDTCQYDNSVLMNQLQEATAFRKGNKDICNGEKPTTLAEATRHPSLKDQMLSLQCACTISHPSIQTEGDKQDTVELPWALDDLRRNNTRIETQKCQYAPLHEVLDCNRKEPSERDLMELDVSAIAKIHASLYTLQSENRILKLQFSDLDAFHQQHMSLEAQQHDHIELRATLHALEDECEMLQAWQQEAVNARKDLKTALEENETLVCQEHELADGWKGLNNKLESQENAQQKLECHEHELAELRTTLKLSWRENRALELRTVDFGRQENHAIEGREQEICELRDALHGARQENFVLERRGEALNRHCEALEAVESEAWSLQSQESDHTRLHEAALGELQSEKERLRLEHAELRILASEYHRLQNQEQELRHLRSALSAVRVQNQRLEPLEEELARLHHEQDAFLQDNRKCEWLDANPAPSRVIDEGSTIRQAPLRETDRAGSKANDEILVVRTPAEESGQPKVDLRETPDAPIPSWGIDDHMSICATREQGRAELDMRQAEARVAFEALDAVNTTGGAEPRPAIGRGGPLAWRQRPQFQVRRIAASHK